MKKKNKIIIITISLIILFSCYTTSTISKNNNLHSVYGLLYINDEISQPGIDVILSFPGDELITQTTENGAYIFSFNGNDEQEGNFQILYNSEYYIPDDNRSIYIEEEIIGYHIDLHILTIQPNNPPNKPINPNPSNNSDQIETSPELSVYVSDPDDDKLTVCFYNASDDSIIDINENINSGSTTAVQWSNLQYNTTYSWYTIAKDLEFETKSDIWTFKTKTKPGNKPSINITHPEEKSLYFKNKNILVFLNGLFKNNIIIGFIDIKVNATDTEGIDHVEFYIDNELVYTDYNAPYNYTLNEKILWIHEIKTIAYDTDNNKAEDSIKLLIFNFKII